MPPEETPQRTLAAALGAMIGVALLVGVAIAGVILVVVKSSGIGDESTDREAAPPSMYLPDLEPTESAATSQPAAPSPSATPTPSESPSAAITLKIAPLTAPPGQRLDLTGTYNGGDGATLQVQRKEGGSWVDFPVSATVRGGQYSTYIMTSRGGANVFRMFDKSAARESNEVTVTLG